MDLILGALESAGSRDANAAEYAEHAARDSLLEARLDQSQVVRFRFQRIFRFHNYQVD